MSFFSSKPKRRAPSPKSIPRRLPVEVNLGGHNVGLERGEWVMRSDADEAHQRTIMSLQDEIDSLRRQLHSSQGSSSVETQREMVRLRDINRELVAENDKLKFQNRVLLALCTISHCDYRALCEEAGIQAPDKGL